VGAACGEQGETTAADRAYDPHAVGSAGGVA
jgi:hypothetical protein